MTDKTAIEYLKTIAKRDDWTSGEIRHFAKTALAAIEAEKPAEDADAVACRIEEIQLLLNDGSIMAKRHAQMVQEIQSFAETYHAEQCKACRKDWQPLPEAPRV